MSKAALKELLGLYSDSALVDLLLTRRPWIFANENEFEEWRRSVTDELGIAVSAVRIVGSASTGYSLSPMKPGRPFRDIKAVAEAPSDIDIAFMHPSLFEEAWNTIVEADRNLMLGGTKDGRGKIKTDIYHGLIAQNSVPRNTAVSRRLLTATAIANNRPPLRGYQVKCRIYRRTADLYAYHVQSIRKLREVVEQKNPGSR